jgi:gluconate 2-dehydrogenase subunit 3-like protein
MTRRAQLLVDPRTGQALPPRDKPGYYPEFSTMEQRNFWDAATREVIVARVDAVPPIRFFDAREHATAEAVFDRILPQDDRLDEFKIPIVPIIDERLHSRRGGGYRFEGTPDDPEAMRLALRAIDATSTELFQMPFHDLTIAQQEAILRALRDGAPLGARAHWEGLPAAHAWTLLVQDAVEAYYAHPWAWDEIGFGGPAYPRGYMRLENGAREPWEVEEDRYEWAAPDGSLSDDYRALKGVVSSGHLGQRGSH